MKKTNAKKVDEQAAVSLEKSGTQAISFPIVGIGASAGGLTAFEAFFSGMPPNNEPNVAFVLVQHLAPSHKSILTEIIQRYTKMHVYEVEDGMSVQINSVYIIPPNHDMALINGRLQLLEYSASHAIHFPIDFFFRSLAQDQLDKAIAIILSGTGSDGTQGIRAIKGNMGMVIAQSPDSCEYSGMPSSAIATGLVDYELPPEKMPVKIMEYVAHAFNIFNKELIGVTFSSDNELRKIFILLRNYTGHDFSQYKPSTINRRIERRMAVNHIESIDLYVRYLQNTEKELNSLFNELLIGVTNFFRDPDSFEALKKALRKLFAKKKTGDTIRVWSMGCSTGEEAYSIAILIQEYMQEFNVNYSVQIFATDIDPKAIAVARAGVYPGDITADISAKRIKRFFTFDADSGKYQINKTIRDMLIFSEQNIIKDPPFSKLDLICCRNLLIYMNSDLQKKVLPIFHYALNPSGILFLGSSETIGEFGNLFDTLDHRSKLYQRKNVTQGIYRMPSHFVAPVSPLPLSTAQVSPVAVKVPLRELTEQTLLEQIIPAAVLINDKGDILYLYKNAGKYLELPSGEVGTNNILKMTHNSLQRTLIIALHKAVETNETVRTTEANMKSEGKRIALNVTVVPVSNSSLMSSKSTLYLVVFEEIFGAEARDETKLQSEENSSISDANTQIEKLSQELRFQEEFLKTSNEKLKISNEELHSSNEEIQSMNEELQSSNEELETSKEELQSVNEELSTVNAELQMKVVDLSRSNNDMNNLLAGTGIGTIFVDHNLHILRFTPAATKIINFILSDIGRPINHIVSNMIGYDTFTQDLQEVLNTLVPKEIPVQTRDEKSYIMRIQPYRTIENVIEGAVITFVEITELLEVREQLEIANKELSCMAAIVKDSNDAIIMQGLEGNILAWNPGATNLYGWSEHEALKMNMQDITSKEYKGDVLKNLQDLTKSELLKPFTLKRKTKEGVVIEVSITATALMDKDEKIYAIATTEREIKSDTQKIKG